MRSPEFKTGILINPAARKSSIKQAIIMGEEIPGSTVHQLEFPLTEKTLPPGFDIVVNCGGDGTQWSVACALIERGENVTMVVPRAGSDNALNSSLQNAGKVITLEDIKSGKIDNVALINPGKINNASFLAIAGVGITPNQYQFLRERIREFPVPIQRQVSSLIAGAYAVTSKNGTEGVHIAFTAPYMGPFNIFPNQDIESDLLTLVTIKANSRVETALKFSIFLGLGLLRCKIPESIAKIEKAKSFKLEGLEHTEAITDGEKVKLASQGTIFFARDSSRHIKATALI